FTISLNSAAYAYLIELKIKIEEISNTKINIDRFCFILLVYCMFDLKNVSQY
ncbi:unnamed protein product, partial [marine sediment metagenome]